MVDTQSDKPFVNLSLVKWHLVLGFTWFMVAITAGILFAFQFHQAYPLAGMELFSPGRIRMIHTQLVAYGFIANCFLAGLYWAVPRLTGERVANDRVLGRIILYGWNLIIAATVLLIATGHAQGIEWGETPMIVDPFVLLSLVLIVVQFAVPLYRCRDQAQYVSMWYFTGALAWTGLVYFMGNWFPQYWVPGTGGAAIAGLYIHDLVGLFITPIGWGLMYYFVPILLKKPIYSHALSLVGFWGLAFFYPLNGVHHFLYSPIPMYAQYGAVASTIAVEVVVTTVVVNFFATLRGRGDHLRHNLPIRWFYVGMIFYFITCLQCAFQVTLTFQKIIHFTDWVVGHSHLVMFGVFGFWILGMIQYLWPRVTGREWYSPRQCEWSFWLMTTGIVIMFLALVMAGLVEGFLWRDLAPFERSLTAAAPFWISRSFAGLLIIAGAVLMAHNMWRTARSPRPADATGVAPATA
jgi:cytochrome c oxidase cbb3-type subunit I